ncbi:MAG: glycosyltransferase family 2 protein [Bacteroidales bacterium]|nr:glycosyltransferase family 2 protein [Bacteroidales bacterium]
MQNNLPDISVITVNYNGKKDTIELIRSLQMHVSLPLEIIVVDNGSRENEALLLQEMFPSVVVIRSEKNLGFSGGNNLGITQAKGKYIFLLNNDTFVTDDTFHYLIERLESAPSIGVVSPKIKFAAPPQNIQFAGYTPLTSVTIRNALIGFGEADNGQHETALQTPFTHGAAMILKREVVNKAGLMPEIFFLYYEELDWCEHIGTCGYELWYEPKCTVFHKESQSTGQNSPLRTYYLTRNRLLFAWRNRKGLTRMLSIIYQLFIVAPKDILRFLLNREYSLASATLRGAFHFYRLKNKKK